MQMVLLAEFRNTPGLTTVRYLGLCSFLALLLGLVLHFLIRYAEYAYGALGYAFSIDYGEGIVWQQALLIPGEKMYASIDTYPFIVFHYPPLYHFAVRAIAFFGLEYLTAGRAISLLSTLSTAVLIGLLTVTATRPTARHLAHIAASIAGLVIFTFSPVFEWSLLMRVDMLAVAFSFFGVYLAVLSRYRPVLLYWASVAFVLALYTKQTSIAAPISTLAFFLLIKPKEAIRATVLAAALGLALLVLLVWQTDGGFVRHIILYNVNRFSAMWGINLTYVVLQRHGLYILVIAAFLLVSWWPILKEARRELNLDRLRARLSDDPWFFGLSLFTVYLLVATTLLVTTSKVGASYNYFVEWICVGCLIIGMAVADALRIVWQTESGASLWGRLALGIGLPVILMGQLLANPARHIGLPPAGQTQQAQIVLQLIEAAKKPVLSEEMTLLMKAGKGVPMEPAIFQELAHKGIWNQGRIIDLINSHFFEFVVIGDRWPVQRWTLEVRKAIEAAYPRLVAYPPYSIYLPINDPVSHTLDAPLGQWARNLAFRGGGAKNAGAMYSDTAGRAFMDSR